MRRPSVTLLALATATAVAMIAPLAAQGVVALEYSGHVSDIESSEVQFDVNRTENGNRKVAQFTTSGVPYTCESGPSGDTQFMMLKARFPVQDDGTFRGKGDTFVDNVDPTVHVRGELRRHGRAVGTVRITGELAKGFDCDTGRLDWRAKKAP